jgi:hypothetical protein
MYEQRYGQLLGDDGDVGRAQPSAAPAPVHAPAPALAPAGGEPASKAQAELDQLAEYRRIYHAEKLALAERMKRVQADYFGMAVAAAPTSPVTPPQPQQPQQPAQAPAPTAAAEPSYEQLLAQARVQHYQDRKRLVEKMRALSEQPGWMPDDQPRATSPPTAVVTPPEQPAARHGGSDLSSPPSSGAASAVPAPALAIVEQLEEDEEDEAEVRCAPAAPPRRALAECGACARTQDFISMMKTMRELVVADGDGAASPAVGDDEDFVVHQATPTHAHAQQQQQPQSPQPAIVAADLPVLSDRDPLAYRVRSHAGNAARSRFALDRWRR